MHILTEKACQKCYHSAYTLEKKKVVGISLLFTCKRIFMLKAHESKTSECDGIRLDVLLIAVYKAQG